MQDTLYINTHFDKCAYIYINTYREDINIDSMNIKVIYILNYAVVIVCYCTSSVSLLSLLCFDGKKFIAFRSLQSKVF